MLAWIIYKSTGSLNNIKSEMKKLKYSQSENRQVMQKWFNNNIKYLYSEVYKYKGINIKSSLNAKVKYVSVIDRNWRMYRSFDDVYVWTLENAMTL